MQWEYNKTNFERNLAVVIGIDRYNSDSIHDLSTPVSDARALAELLETEYEYKPQNVIRLFDQAATLTGLQTLLTDTLPNQLKPTKGDRLIFYFAGHGIPRNSKDGPEGYLVPQDADWQKEDSFLPMSKVYEALSKLECHHLLVILDCCFAGTFRWAGRRKMIPILETVRREHYDRFIRYPAWQVITSAAHDQEALDVAKLASDKRGAVADENQELHSPFALALLEGLRENKADVIPDGVITAHELYLYLDQQVSQLSGSRQKPGIYPMRLEYDRGEFVFTRPGFTSSQLKPAPLLNESNNPYRGLASFDEKHANFFFGRKILVEALQRRLSQPNRSLTVVLGASGSGKSSLVKAGLIPDLRQESKWYILDPMRPDRSPFTALARAILPIEKPELIEQLDQVSFLDEVFKPKDESGQDDSDEPTDAAFVKLAEFWNSAKSEAKLLLVEDYFKQLLALCRNPQQEEQLSQLNRAIFEKLESLSNRLQEEPQHLTRVIRKWSESHPDAKLLLTIDQFEELITMSQESQTETHGGDRQEGDSRNETVGERAAEPQPWLPFLLVLRGAIVECPQQLHIVLTLRSDFEPRFLSSPLSAYWKDARFPVRAMNLDELRQAIEGPALKQALYFEPPELVGKLIDEVGQMPGALPLLSFTLSELYIKLHERWTKDNASDRALRIKDYEELGGVAGALTRRATEEYDNLVKDLGEESGKRHQATMRRVMLRMVVIEGGGVARRRVPESELVYPDLEENKRVAQVSDRLIKARLLVKGQETGEPYVEPAHDFLVRGWDKLQGWIKEEQEDLTLQHRLTPAANDWKHGRGMLWIEEVDRLAKLEKVLEAETDNWLNQLETEFVTRSIKERQDRIKKLEEELRISEQRRARAEIREKAIRAENLLQVQPLDALILAIQAIGQNLEELPEEILAPAQMSLHRAMKTARVAIPLQGHEQNVSAVAFSPDGRMIVSGSVDNTVRLWDIQGNPIGEPLRGHENYVSSVAFSPDGKIIASGSYDNTVRLWDIQGNPIGEPLRGHENYVSSVAFSPDGKIIASGSYDNTVRLWDIQGNPIGEPLRGHEGAVKSVAFVHPDGWIVVSGSEDSTVRLWDIQGNPIGEPLRGHQGAVYSVALSQDGQMIASGGADATVRLWNIQGNPIGEPFRGHQRAVLSIAFSPDGRMIVSNGADGIARLWDIQGKLIDELLWKAGGIQRYSPETTFSFGGQFEKPVTFDMPLWAKEGFVYSVAFSPDGQMIASGSEDNIIRLWDIRGDGIGGSFQEHDGAIISLAVSPDRQMIASSGKDKTVRLWDSQGNPIGEPFQTSNEVETLTFSPNSQMIAGCGMTGAVYLWDLQGNLIDDPFYGYGLFNQAIAFNTEGNVIVSKAGVDAEVVTVGQISVNVSKDVVCFWDVKGNPIGEPIEMHDNAGVESVAFSPNNQIIASSDGEGKIKFWDMQGYLISKTVQGHKDTGVISPINTIAFSPDGRLVASGGKDKTVRLWDIQGNPIGEPLQGHEDDVLSVVFSPDGQVVISGSRDKMLWLWDIQGNPIGEPLQDLVSVFSVTSTPDGKTLIVSGNHDGTLHFWRVGWRAWLEVCCDRLRYHPVFKNPETEAEKFACKTCCIQRGRTLAIEGDIEAAIVEFQSALNLDPNLKIDPESESRRLRTEVLLELQQRLAAQATDWDRNNRPDGLLLPDGDSLNCLEKLLLQNDSGLNQLEIQFIQASLNFRDLQKHRARELQVRAELQQKAARVLSQISINPLESIALAIQVTGQNLEEIPNEMLAPVQRSLHEAMNKARIPKSTFKGQHTQSGCDARICDLESDEIGQPFHAHDTEITTVIFSPDGQKIASSSFDKTIRLWNLEGKQIGKTFEGHKETVYSIAFSPNGEMIVSGSYDRTIRLWNLKGEQIGSLFGDEDVRSVAFSPNGQIIASTGMEGTVRLWDLKGNAIGCLPYRNNEQPAGFNKLAFSPDGQKIACLGPGFSIRLWDWQKNFFQDSVEESPNVIKSIGFSPDGQRIVTSNVGGAVCLWDCGENLSRQQFHFPDSVYSACFSPDGQTIISGSSNVVLWDTQGDAIATLQGQGGGFVVACSPDGQIIAGGGWNGTIYLWRGNWKAWLQVCCERIRNHSVFKEPQTDSAKAVCDICQKYVWDESVSKSELIKGEEVS